MTVATKIVVAAMLVVGALVGGGGLGLGADVARAEVPVAEVAVVAADAVVAQAPTTADGPDANQDGTPSIIPRPDEGEGRSSNVAGFVIALGLFLAWIGGAALLFWRAAQRRRQPIPGS